ncbi:unnamed protein product [Effrenium voratum]|uniref:Uncharacterized protein n=1 Tax=Effrenium voratum TaxID=2562239 RepID=A0AA36IYT8_9DINO|nr:unnamed protein product [Effrenium voratum]
MSRHGNNDEEEEQEDSFSKSVLRLGNGKSLAVFLVPSSQVHWATRDVMQQIFRTNSNKKLRTHATDKRATAEDEHRLLWPGMIPAESKLGFSRQSIFQSQSTRQEALEPDLWADVNTTPTSMVMSFLKWSMSNIKRTSVDRLLAYEFWKQLMVKLFSTIGGAHIAVLRAGARFEAAVEIDVSGKFSTAELWSTRVGARMALVWKFSLSSLQHGLKRFQMLFCWAV